MCVVTHPAPRDKTAASFIVDDRGRRCCIASAVGELIKWICCSDSLSFRLFALCLFSFHSRSVIVSTCLSNLPICLSAYLPICLSVYLSNPFDFDFDFGRLDTLVVGCEPPL